MPPEPIRDFIVMLPRGSHAIPLHEPDRDQRDQQEHDQHRDNQQRHEPAYAGGQSDRELDRCGTAFVVESPANKGRMTRPVTPSS